jgi:hypothetical protein
VEMTLGGGRITVLASPCGVGAKEAKGVGAEEARNEAEALAQPPTGPDLIAQGYAAVHRKGHTRDKGRLFAAQE